MSESGLGLPYRGWERFFAAIGTGYGTRLREATDRAHAELAGADDEALVAIARAGRAAANSLDEDGARLTVRLHEQRDRHAGLASNLEQQSDDLLHHAPRGWSAGRRAERHHARAQAAERRERAAAHREQARAAQEQIRELDAQSRHPYAWFEQHRETLAHGLAAEQLLSTGDRAVYHVLGAPSIASLTAASLTPERAIDLDELAELVKSMGDERQRVLFDIAMELRAGSERKVTVDELLEQLHGEDLDRVLEAIAIRRRRGFRGVTAPTDLWIRAAEPERE